MKACLVCSKPLLRSSYRYCSNKCASTYKYNLYIQNWKKGKVDGSRGRVARNISGHIRRYLLEKSGEKCSLCGWCRKNLKTHRVPLEVDHIDGNSENNCEENLRLICPNCHALSSNYRNLNKGKGRIWRKEKYIKVN